MWKCTISGGLRTWHLCNLGKPAMGGVCRQGDTPWTPEVARGAFLPPTFSGMLPGLNHWPKALDYCRPRLLSQLFLKEGCSLWHRLPENGGFSRGPTFPSLATTLERAVLPMPGDNSPRDTNTPDPFPFHPNVRCPRLPRSTTVPRGS